jgi:CNT family concentrative nucleoside transporter
MVFGRLQMWRAGEDIRPGAFVFAVTVTATIILVSALSALLYHWGVLQRVVAAVAVVMQRVMRTSGSESLAAAGISSSGRLRLRSS